MNEESMCRGECEGRQYSRGGVLLPVKGVRQVLYCGCKEDGRPTTGCIKGSSKKAGAS